MPLRVRSSARRRRRNPEDRESTSSTAQEMAPTRMKLRVRRRDAAAAGAAGGGGGGGGGDQPEEEEERSRESSGRSSRRKTSSNASTAPNAAASSSSPPPTSSASARVLVAAEEASPDSKCPICLDRFNNLAYLDRCLHRFCFPCIQEWSHNKAECPLCKQPFASILHSVRAEDDFKEYTLRPPPANSSVAATVAMVAAMASAARSDHQMRLMLRRHRGADSETTTRRRRRERGGRGGGGGGDRERRSGVWEWYLDSPSLALPPLPHHLAVSPAVAEDSEEAEELEEQRGRRGADLAERGVIFEGLTGLGSAAAPAAPNDRASRRLMTRLVARQRLQREGGTVRRLRERETVTFRRALYRSSIRVRGVAGGNGNQQQRDITAESFRRNPTHLNRLRPWLRRELTVLYGAHASLVDIVQRIIMARLARHGLEDTPTVEEELRPFLLARTDHFLHELVSFARSPLSLESYDAAAVYEPPDAAMELDAMSSSSDGDSIIAISEGEEEEERPAGGRAEEAAAARGGAHDDIIQAGSCLSLAAWDDETPGPSYSTAEPSCSLASPPFSSAPQEAANEQRGEKREEEEEEEECLIVGYKKPIAERTPELVQLSSDTEEDEEKKKKKEAESLPAPPPAATPPLSYLPTIPPSTSGAYEQDDVSKEKDGEVNAPPPRVRSWSGSSGRSRKSVCTLSPATPPGATPPEATPPGASDRRRERNRKSCSEKRRRKKKKRRKGRERSGTMFNPNRSIFPAMLRRRSPSPFHSSLDSGSPPPSPTDSAWEFHGAHISPLTSSASSPSRSSSSSSTSSTPLCSPPQPASRTAPIPSASPDRHGEKPGGKRKYKSRHLDSDDKDPTWRPREKRREKEERRRRRGRRRDRRTDGESSRRSRDDRSPSVEIIYEGTISASMSPARKRRRKRHRGTQQSSSPVIITLDSDSSHEDAKNVSSVSSSPLSSQQTVDFSDLPLPAPSAAIAAAALGADIGELPVDILDRGSDASDGEPPAAIAVDSDHDVDVENVEEGESLPASDDDDGPKTAKTRGGDAAAVATTTTRQRDSEFSDSRLLATILNDLKGFAADCKRPGERLADDLFGIGLPTVRNAIRPPPLERLREEVKDVPPLLKQASPVRSYNRNTPPPLKHKDAGSPHPSPAPPHHDAAGAGNAHIDLHSNPNVDSRLGDAANASVIPPISTLKRNFTNALALAGDPDGVSASLDSHSPPKGALSASSLSASSRHKPSPSSSSSGRSSHLELNSFHSLHSGTNKVNPPGLKSASVDLHPVNYFPDFPPGWSSEKPAHADSTSGSCRDTSPTSRLLAPVDLHPSAGRHVFSGVARNDTSLPAFVSSLDPRTRNISSPVDSRSPGKTQNSLPAPAVSLSPVDLHPESPGSTVDLLSSSSAGPLDSKVSSLVNHEKRSPYGRLPPVDFHPPPPPLPAPVRRSSGPGSAADQHLNHTALSSAPFAASRRNSSSSDPVDSRSKLLDLADAKLRNHVDPPSDASLPKHNLTAGFQTTVDSHPKNSETDNHAASSRTSTENRWNAVNAVEAPDSHMPESRERDLNV